MPKNNVAFIRPYGVQVDFSRSNDSKLKRYRISRPSSPPVKPTTVTEQRGPWPEVSSCPVPTHNIHEGNTLYPHVQHTQGNEADLHCIPSDATAIGPLGTGACGCRTARASRYMVAAWASPRHPGQAQDTVLEICQLLGCYSLAMNAEVGYVWHLPVLQRTARSTVASVTC